MGLVVSCIALALTIFIYYITQVRSWALALQVRSWALALQVRSWALALDLMQSYY